MDRLSKAHCLSGLLLAVSLVVGPALAETPAEAAKPAEAAQSKARFQWAADLESATKLATKDKKLILLDFYTDWCGWCKRLDRDVFAKDEWMKAAGGVVGLKVNAEKGDANRALARKYRVTSYPRLFFVDAQGRTLERIKGYMNLKDFTAKVQQVQQGNNEFQRLRAAAGDPSDLRALQSFAAFLSDTDQTEESIAYWQQVHDLSLERLFERPGAGNEFFHRQALLKLGEAFASVELDEVARQHFTEVTMTYAQSREAPLAMLELAKLEVRKGNRTEANRLVSELANKYPRSQANRAAQAMRAQLRGVGQ